MKTKIIITKKTLLDRLKEFKFYNKLYIVSSGDNLTVIFNGVLTDGQLQKIRDLLGDSYYLIVEEVDKFPEVVM